MLYTIVDELFVLWKLSFDFIKHFHSDFNSAFVLYCALLSSALDLNPKYLNVFILLWLVMPWLIKFLYSHKTMWLVFKIPKYSHKTMWLIFKIPKYSHETPWLVFKIPKHCHKMLRLVFKIQCSDWFLKFLNMVIKRCNWSSLHGDVRLIVRNI